MSKTNVILGFLLVLTTGVAAVFGFRTSEAIAAPKWEYSITSFPDSALQTEIDKMGDGGWEMVFARRASDGNTVHATMSYEMIFKRRAQNKQPSTGKPPSLLPN